MAAIGGGHTRRGQARAAYKLAQLTAASSKTRTGGATFDKEGGTFLLDFAAAELLPPASNNIQYYYYTRPVSKSSTQADEQAGSPAREQPTYEGTSASRDLPWF